MTRATIRHATNVVMFGVTAVCTVGLVSVLFTLLGYLMVMGAGSINLDFLTQLPRPVGEAGGGMANAIVGSAKLLLIAAVTGLPVGFATAVYVSEYSGTRTAAVVRYAMDLLMAVPSIVVGIFVYGLIVLPMRQFSTLAGGVALGVIIIPLVARSAEEFLRAVPGSLREASLALGASRSTTILRVVVPAAIPGLATAAVLGLARVSGETAPLLFTALSNRFWSPGLLEPTASLPVMIFTYALSPYEEWHRQAWAAALLLLGFVVAAALTARLLARKSMVSSS